MRTTDCLATSRILSGYLAALYFNCLVISHSSEPRFRLAPCSVDTLCFWKS